LKEEDKMKKLLSRLPINRSLTRPLSTVAVAVVAFAAMQLLAAQPAFAGIVCCTNSSGGDCLCDSSTACNITKNGKFYGTRVGTRLCWNYSKLGASSTITSTIVCDPLDNVNAPGNITVDPLDLTSFSQNALLACEVTDSVPARNDTGVCQLELSYTRSDGLAQCTNNPGNPGPNDDTSTLTYAGFCTDVGSGAPGSRLQVAGKLQCGEDFNPGAGNLPLFCDGNPDCVLNLGIADTQGKCDDLFPAVTGLGAGQVLGFSQTVEGLNCGTDGTDRQVINIVGPATQYCTGGTFNEAAVDCTPGTVLRAGGATAESAVQFDVTFSPTTLNVTCGPNNNDTWHFTILGNQHLDVARINPLSLKVEGEGGVFCDTANVAQNTLTCHIKGCQKDPNLKDLGPVIKANRNPDGTVDLTVTGSLASGTAIFGEDINHKTSGN
jgi:hypothetical protein